STPRAGRQIELDSVDRPCSLFGHEAVLEILEHAGPGAPARIAVAPAGPGVDPDDVVAVDLQCRHDGVGLDGAAGADDLDVVGGSFEPSFERPRSMLVARVRAREETPVRPHAVLEDDPLAAAKLALAAGLVVEGEPVDIEAVTGLGNLDRTVEGVAVEAAEHRVVPVAPGRASPAPDLRLDDREVTAGIRMAPADERPADRAEAPGREAVAEMGCEAAPDQVVEPDFDLVVGREP